MNGRTLIEIKEFIGSIYGDDDIEYRKVTDKHICFEVIKMYEYVKTDFETLTEISKFFNTTKIKSISI